MVKLSLRSRHWVVDGQGNIVFGRGRMIILDSIAQTGSINQTAKNLKMSYKTVWSKIKSTEKHLKAKVVHADRASGTRLTPTGEHLVSLFKQMSGDCMAADDRIFSRVFQAPMADDLLTSDGSDLTLETRRGRSRPADGG